MSDHSGSSPASSPVALGAPSPVGASGSAPAASKGKRGGARPGAGRKPKGHKPAAALAPIDIAAELAAPVPAEIDGVAQRHASTMVVVLVRTMLHGRTESARIAAANIILDRGYGRPAVEIGGDAWLPFQAAPEAKPTVTTSVREECRRHANLAIEVLRRIAELGESEAARVRAAESIIARGIGTVGAAKMPEDYGKRAEPSRGKKEEASIAAREAATGAYATPAPPRSSEGRLQ